MKLEEVECNLNLFEQFTLGPFREITSSTIEDRPSKVRNLNKDKIQYDVCVAFGHCVSQSKKTTANFTTWLSFLESPVSRNSFSSAISI